MGKSNSHITAKIILGYLILIIAGIFTIAYIYSFIEEFVSAPDDQHENRKKIYLVTNTLSLIYESEAIGQVVSRPNKNIMTFEQPLNKAQANMDTLREYTLNDNLIEKIDSISLLIERKKNNTRKLLKTWKKLDVDQLYTEHIERIIAKHDTVIRQIEFNDQSIIQKDSILIPTPPVKKSFLDRLKDALIPPQNDSILIYNKTNRVLADTIVHYYNPADTIASVLKILQDSVAVKRKQLMEHFLDRLSILHYDNTITTNRLNQLLHEIEKEEMAISLKKALRKQEIQHKTVAVIARISILSLLILIILIFIIIKDVSHSKYYRIQLEKANDYAQKLLSIREKLMLSISHDIRSPLSSIIGYIGLLKKQAQGRQYYYLENMEGSAQHILSLANNLLDMHRIESGKLQIQEVSFSLVLLIKEIYNSFQPLSINKGLKLILQINENEFESYYKGDPIRFRQIVSNLLSNAIKFTESGEIILSLKKSNDNQLILSVKDTGNGIPKDQQEQIFTEFTRLSKTDYEEGFGLGLSITLKLIELMHGKINLDSNPGEGSTFTVILPLNPTQLGEETFQDNNLKNSEEINLKREGIRCLIVDDNPFQLELTQEILRLHKISVSTCSDSRKVIDILSKNCFDVIITDIQMPGIDGFTLLKNIRSSNIKNASSLPIIALSASVDKENNHYIKAGFTKFLNKPFTANQLIELINELLPYQTNDVKKQEFNFTALTSFAEDDVKAAQSILNSFIKETQINLEELNKTKINLDRSTTKNIAHKIVPIFSMIKAKELVSELRVLEKNDTNMNNKDWLIILNDVIKQINNILLEAKKNNHLY